MNSVKINQSDFVKWVREVINPQASAAEGNSVCLDDYSKDGNTEYSYPKSFIVNGDSYYWTVSSWPTKGRGMSSHYELWFHGPAFVHNGRIATGDLTLGKVRKGLKQIYAFYEAGNKTKAGAKSE